MIFFTADFHFGHENIIKHCSRPFQSLGLMNGTLIGNWNTTVGSDDTVYILGDLFFGGGRSPDEYIQLIQSFNGKKFLTPGNHDSVWMKHIDLSSCFEDVALMMEISYDKKHILTLCHYPMMSWKDDRDGTGYMIHGHIHNRTDADYFPIICSNPNMLNAGVDVNNFKPVTFEELLKNNQKFKKSALNIRHKI
jgi:calcineurin-like phosphoesterase family protein